MRFYRKRGAELDRWFVGRVIDNKRKFASVNLINQGFTVFDPFYRKTRKRSGRNQCITSPLFPGYIFLSFDPEADRWQSVNSTYGMCYLVAMRGGLPSPVPRNVMEALQRRCPDGEWQLGESNLMAGDEVKILEGPFAGVGARFVEMESGERVKLLLNLLGGEIPVTIAARHMGLNIV